MEVDENRREEQFVKEQQLMEKKLISNTKLTFESLNMDLHFVFCVENRMFDWLPGTRHVRPYNSSGWNTMPENPNLLTVAEVMEYFESIYQSLLTADDGNPENEGDIKIGTKYGKILAVDIDKTMKHLSTIVSIFEKSNQYTSEEIEDFQYETDVLIEQAENLKNYLLHIYSAANNIHVTDHSKEDMT